MKYSTPRALMQVNAMRRTAVTRIPSHKLSGTANILWRLTVTVAARGVLRCADGGFFHSANVCAAQAIGRRIMD
jgi:hypothetical protein